MTLRPDGCLQPFKTPTAKEPEDSGLLSCLHDHNVNAPRKGAFSVLISIVSAPKIGSHT